ncbi:MAG: SagB family peptide dehydrogenase [Deltaproteobacteria bacterium]|nr:SagB family peptide dehydrogenase [Deltaproteobacteria bacterium]
MLETALQYHNHTSYDPKEMSGHGLDWANQPNVYKEYPGIEPIQLSLEVLNSPSPSPLPQGGEGLKRKGVLPRKLASVLKDDAVSEIGSDSLNIDDLSLLLRLTNTLTAKSSHPGGDFYYRSAASAGALYPTEIYVATHGVKALDDGLYHFAIHRHALFPLRKGDFSNYVTAHVAHMGNKIPVITVFLTAIFFRSAWKYRERSYRYHLLDTGHVMENLTLALKALHLPFRLSYDFDDDPINHLLGLNETKEITLAMACITTIDGIHQPTKQNLDKLTETFRKASNTAKKEIDYPAVREIHLAGTPFLAQKGAMPDMGKEIGLATNSWIKISPSLNWSEILEYPDAMFNRRSQRHYAKNPMSKDSFIALLDTLLSKDFQGSDMVSSYEQSVGTGFIVNDIEGFSRGLYLLNRSDQSIGLVSSDVLTSQMARICLGQSWLTNASVHFLFMSNLDLLDQARGPRGYRYAMMTAGRWGERLYVASTAMGLGCCGIGAFYDMHAAQTIGLNGASWLLYLVAVGTIR